MKQELLNKLKALGLNVDGISPDDLDARLSEKVILRKFEGEKLVETVTIEDGQVTIMGIDHAAE